MLLTEDEKNQRLSSVEINEVFSSLVQTEISLLYWPVLIRNNIRLDRWSKIIILASSALASSETDWVIHHPYKWQAIVFVIAVLSIIQLILDFASNVSEMNQIYEKIVELQCDYEELFRELTHLPRLRAIKRYNSIKRTEVDVAKRAAKFTKDIKLRNRCYTEALQARGLKSPLVTQEGRKKRWQRRILNLLFYKILPRSPKV